MKSRLFTYAIIWNPNEKETKEGKKPTLLVPPTHALAADQNSVQIMAAMNIPNEYKDSLDQIEIAVRPF